MELITRTELERREQENLAPYATLSSRSRGRAVPENPDRLRTEFQRDRDRIIHCRAFRKLQYKTQVYVTHEGDYFRTRLTHSLEVAQIGRTIASSLGLNRVLAEAIALAHDLGHTPFGHAGERVLNDLLNEHGGYEHNDQSLRVVEVLEQRFHDRPGLNLTWELRAGIAHHMTAYDNPTPNEYQEAGMAPLLETQVVDVADQIAYNCHDIDDALSMGLLKENQLREVDWVWEIWERARAKVPAEHIEQYGAFRALGALMDAMVNDVLETSRANIEAAKLGSTEDARRVGRPLILFSAEMEKRQECLRDFLMANVYRHPATLRMCNKASMFFRRLFELYRDNPDMLPLDHQKRIVKGNDESLMRVLTDYMSGMTDRHCLEEYMNHFEPSLRWLD